MRIKLLMLSALTSTLALFSFPVPSWPDVSYKSYTAVTRVSFPVDAGVKYSIVMSDSEEGRSLVLSAESASLFEGFSPLNIEDGLVQRLDMNEAGGRKTIRIGLGPEYHDFRSFMAKHPYRLVVEVLGRGGQAPDHLSSPSTVVVVDAGHGGTDAGAQGLADGKEKDFCLDLAVRVQKLLKRDPSYKVIMTRNADYTISDTERAAIANQNAGDMFVSIHAAYLSGGQAPGHSYIQDWLVTEARLDAADVRPEIKQYLWWARNLPHVYSSAVLAAAIEGELTGRVVDVKENMAGTLPSPVLSAVDMPAVMVEVIDSPGRGGGLALEKYRQEIAERIVKGIKAVRNPRKPGGRE